MRRLVGITGTNGKTSVVHYLQHAAWSCGCRSIGISSLGVVLGNGLQPDPRAIKVRDLLGPDNLHETATRLRLDYVFVEMFSAALAKGHWDRCQFDAGIYTNITSDHLDYHGSVEDYVAAKAVLADRLVKDGGDLIVPHAVLLCLPLQDARLRSLRVGLVPDIFNPEIPFGDRAASLPSFDVANRLVALTAGIRLGIGTSQLADVILSVPRPPGRLEEIWASDTSRIFIDYGHNADGMRHVLDAVRASCSGRVLTVFGCGGNKDPYKRKEMGAVASEIGDIVIVTEDNSRNEPLQDILTAIVSGCPQSIVVPDRSEAIARAIAMMEDGDCLVVFTRNDEGLASNTNKLNESDREIIMRTISS